ncbi:MAG: UbiA family prenyltransferase [Candidatus Aenigmarchaeota archaeon]|nr:UbiA family prenyltransferase [Candidatus Aenigmarchaeota archaeon]
MWLFFRLCSFSFRHTNSIPWLSHIVLGISWAIGPLGGWVAVTGSFGSFSIPLALALSGALWVAGFDIIYALLDVEFDKKEGLFSIPAAFGTKNALRISFALHAAMFLPLLYVQNAMGLGISYVACLVVAAALILYEHAISRRRDEKSINTAFFNVNAVVGWILFLGILGGVL